MRIVPCPFAVAVDTREQNPFEFAAIGAGSRHPKGSTMGIDTIRTTLRSGDYSIYGHEDKISIERKSLADLFSTLGQGRKRFESELMRLAYYKRADIVIEGTWTDILLEPPERSKLRPKTVHASLIAWRHEFPLIHWWPCANRYHAERTTFDLLMRYWKLWGCEK